VTLTGLEPATSGLTKGALYPLSYRAVLGGGAAVNGKLQLPSLAGALV
jgi:hypothetical protein